MTEKELESTIKAILSAEKQTRKQILLQSFLIDELAEVLKIKSDELLEDYRELCAINDEKENRIADLMWEVECYKPTAD